LLQPLQTQNIETSMKPKSKFLS